MTTEKLNSYFQGYITIPDYQDEMSVKVYYSKSEFLRIPIQYGIDDKYVNYTLSKYKRVVINLITLIKWLKSDNDLSKNINAILTKYFFYDVCFNLTINKKIELKYFDEVEFFDLNNICDDTKRNEVLNVILDSCELKKNKRMKYLENNLPKAMLKIIGDSHNSIYLNYLTESEEWTKFKKLVFLSNSYFNEFKQYMHLDGFLYKNELTWLELTEYPKILLNPTNYKVSISDGISFYYGNSLMFSIVDGNVEKKYEETAICNVLKSFDIMWRMHHDLMRALDGYSKENLCFRIDNEGFIWLHNYSQFIKIDNFNDTYKFALNTKDLIKKSKQITDKQKKLLDFITVNMVGRMKQCVDMDGFISMDRFVSLCNNMWCRTEYALEVFGNSTNILQHLKEEGIIESWIMVNKTTYEAVFINTEIICYDNYETSKNQTIIEDGYSLRDTINLFPKKVTVNFLKNRIAVKEHTLEFLTAIDDKKFCADFEKEILCAVNNIDKKYIPLLKLKLLKENAENTFGAHMYAALSKYVENL